MVRLPCTDVHLSLTYLAPTFLYHIPSDAHARLILEGSRNKNTPPALAAEGTPKKRGRSQVGPLPEIARRIIASRPGRSSFSSKLHPMTWRVIVPNICQLPARG